MDYVLRNDNILLGMEEIKICSWSLENENSQLLLKEC